MEQDVETTGTVNRSKEIRPIDGAAGLQAAAASQFVKLESLQEMRQRESCVGYHVRRGWGGDHPRRRSSVG